MYAGLLGQGKREEADRVAGAVSALLGLGVAVLVLLGVVLTPALIDLVAPGFEGEKRAQTILLVRILFPGAGLLVMSAWCLGVLNSHGRFLLSYAAPVIWNAAIIAVLLWFGPRTGPYPLATAVAWGAVLGSLLQLLVQLPGVRSLLHDYRPALRLRDESVRTVVRNFAPSLASRGVVQISAYIDQLLASLLPTGAVAALVNAQMVALLPVSLFGMSISAAELPAMSREAGGDGTADRMRARLGQGLQRIAFFGVPSAAVFAGLGHVVAGAIFENGEFTAADSRYIWALLAGSAVGLLATTFGRLYSSALFALKDTRTPFRFALIRFGLTTVLGYISALKLPGLLGIDARWGAAGLTASAGIAGWVECLLLSRTLHGRIGPVGVGAGLLARLWLAAALGVGAGWLVLRALPVSGHPVVTAVLVLGACGLVYLGCADVLGIPEAREARTRIVARLSVR